MRIVPLSSSFLSSGATRPVNLLPGKPRITYSIGPMPTVVPLPGDAAFVSRCPTLRRCRVAPHHSGRVIPGRSRSATVTAPTFGGLHRRRQHMVVASEWGVGQVLWSMIWFTLLFMWIWLVISIFTDIFRSHDLSGFSKVVWTFFVIVAPFLGVFVYLIARGKKMGEHAIEDAQRQDAAARAYIKDTVAAPS